MSKLPPYKMISVDELQPHKNNSRTHSDEQIEQIRRSIEQFGFTNPVLIDGKNKVIAGHGRLLAAKKMGMGKIPCLQIDWLTEKQKRAYVIADNKIAENAGWDKALLRLELGELADDEFDVSVIGFSDDEINRLFDDGVVDIEEIDTSHVIDRFWISIRGQLEHQAEALQRLQSSMQGIDVDVELGTVEIDT